MNTSMSDTSDILLRTTRSLSEPSALESSMTPCGSGHYPSVEALDRIIEIVRNIIFPDFFDRQRSDNTLRSYFIGVNVERLYTLLKEEISHALKFIDVCERDEAEARSASHAVAFIERLPEVKRLIYSDVEAIFNNDPAVNDYGEIVLCYPAVRAMLNYRVARQLLLLEVPVIPRMLTETAHSETGIDINPGAKIGAYFAIDHGTGIVIGETAIIGNRCTLYQGVTLGAKNFVVDSEGRPVNVPRHPILEDNVTVYSNATILGRITVGHDSIIGGNVWLTTSVPPGSRVLQRRPLPATFTDGAGI